MHICHWQLHNGHTKIIALFTLRLGYLFSSSAGDIIILKENIYIHISRTCCCGLKADEKEKKMKKKKKINKQRQVKRECITVYDKITAITSVCVCVLKAYGLQCLTAPLMEGKYWLATFAASDSCSNNNISGRHMEDTFGIE